MPLQPKKHRKWLIAGTALLLTATPGFALFGLGDIVFDPTSYASLVSQLTTLETQYKMLKNNITHFSLKQQWQTTLHTLENANVANMFGETAGIKIALNSNSPSTSSTAWKTATISMNSGTSSYLQGQSLGSSRMSQLAMIETADSISPDCLTAVGQYRSNRTENATANHVVALLNQHRCRCRGVYPPTHAADDALTFLRIHSGTLYNAPAACKMVCKAGQRKITIAEKIRAIKNSRQFSTRR